MILYSNEIKREKKTKKEESHLKLKYDNSWRPGPERQKKNIKSLLKDEKRNKKRIQWK